MQPAELKLFFEKFALGTNGEVEHQLFIEWLKTAPIEDVKAILEECHINIAGNHLPSGEIDLNLVAKIEAALDQYESDEEIRYVNDKKVSWRFFLRVAAALVIFVSGIAVYFALKTTPHHTIAEAPSQQLKNEVVPGGNKAILTLSDGSAIILDDVKNGEVAQQGGTQIAKLANGQLVYNYNASGNKPTEVAFNTLTTPRGGQFKLTLPDGSKVWLNAVSSIKYPTAFIGSKRKVEISGEAYFEIAHDAAKPFEVSVNGMVVKVLGTHFNINAYDDEASVKTTLLEGSVSLTKGSATATLKPGQQAQVGNGRDIKVINDADVDQAVAWKNGYFSFNRVGLQTVMRQIARWYDVEVSYEGKIPERQFGGKIDRSSSISDVLKILEESKVHFRLDGKKIIVSP